MNYVSYKIAIRIYKKNMTFFHPVIVGGVYESSAIKICTGYL